jgi:hypothetical protein
MKVFPLFAVIAYSRLNVPPINISINTKIRFGANYNSIEVYNNLNKKWFFIQQY